jgi:hypothetical protein
LFGQNVGEGHVEISEEAQRFGFERFQPFEEIIIDHLRKNAAECTRLRQEFRTSAHKSFFGEMAEWRVGLAQHEKTQDK